MWKQFENSKWVRRILMVEGLGSFGSAVWNAITSLFGQIVGLSAVTGAMAAVLDGYGFVGVLAIAMAFALGGTILLLLLIHLYLFAAKHLQRLPVEDTKSREEPTSSTLGPSSD